VVLTLNGFILGAQFQYRCNPVPFDEIKITLKSSRLNNLSLTVTPSDKAEPVVIHGVSGTDVELEVIVKRETDDG